MAGTCTGLKCGLYVYLFRQYFRNVPKDIEEAAYLDGCGTLRTLFNIMLPDAMPLATSCFLFSFVWQWTDNYFSTLLTKSTNLLPARLNSVLLPGAGQTFCDLFRRAERHRNAAASDPGDRALPGRAKAVCPVSDLRRHQNVIIIARL